MKNQPTEPSLNALGTLIETLRGKDGCPWDKKQTPRSMAAYLLEETYELVEAIESGTPEEVCEELGDVLFLILFVSRLYQERGHFDIQKAARNVYEKMVRRHPHVFGDEKAEGADEVKQRWQKIKLKEKCNSGQMSVLDTVSPGLPALMRAYRISERAAQSGFDWNDLTGVMQKVEEEWSEFKDELGKNRKAPARQDPAAMEFGDILFTLVNVARFADIHPETALTGAVRKFEKRFKHMERVFSEDRRDLESVSHEEMNKIWKEAKKTIT
jgi:MazG family protein